MTIDCENKNKNGPGRYRSSADNSDEQVCYFNKPNYDEYYNVFISKRIKSEISVRAFILKLKKLEEKQTKRTLTLRKL